MKQCPNCKVYRLEEDSSYKTCDVCREAKKKSYYKKHGENGEGRPYYIDKFKVGKIRCF